MTQDFDTDSGVISEPKLMAKYLGGHYTLSASGKVGADQYRGKEDMVPRVREQYGGCCGEY